MIRQSLTVACLAALAATASAGEIAIDRAVHHLGDDVGAEGTFLDLSFTVPAPLANPRLELDFVRPFGPSYETPPHLILNATDLGSIQSFFPPLDLSDSRWQTNPDGSHDYNGGFHVSIPVDGLLNTGSNLLRVQNGRTDDDYYFAAVVVSYTSVSITDAAATEGAAGTHNATAVVRLSGPGSGSVTLDWATADGTAQAGSDYAASSGTLTLSAAQPSAQVRVPVFGDTAPEPDETFTVSLTSVTGATVDRGTATVTIADDDTPPPLVARSTWVRDQEGMATIWGSAFGVSRYVLVGDWGYISASPDGVTWSRQANPDTTVRRLFGVAFGNGIFVAVGDGYSGRGSYEPAILSSPDGLSWTLHSDPSRVGLPALNDVGFGNGLFVAVGDDGVLLTSADGAAWTARASGTSRALRDVAYGGGRFVAVGDSGTVVTSLDGVTWTVETGAPASLGGLQAVAYGGGVFVAGSSNGLFSSPDGAAWTSRQPGSFADVAFDGALFVAVDFGAPSRVFTSADGANWTEATLEPTSSGVSRSLHTVTAGGGGFVAAGYVGALFTSPDGVTQWTSRALPESRSYLSVATDGTGFCAVGNWNSAARSPDGVNWTTMSGAWSFVGITYAQGQFLAVGYDAVVYSSPDCVSWTVLNPAGTYPPGTSGATFRAVTYDGGQYVAVGDRTQTGDGFAVPLVVTSPDGVTWTERNPALPTLVAGQLLSVTYGNGRHVAVGYSHASGATYMITSTDGVGWAPLADPPFEAYEDLNAVTFGNGRFVAAGNRIWTSTDGLSWSLVKDYQDYFFAAGYGGGRFVAAGGWGEVYTSRDGTAWTKNVEAVPDVLLGVAYSASQDRWVAVGDPVLTHATGVAPPAVSVADAQVAEGQSGSSTASVLAYLDGASAQTATVAYATSDVTATAGIDYTTTSGTLSFAPGTVTRTIDVPVAGDTTSEPDETFTVTLWAPNNATIARGTATVTILDDDTLIGSFAASPAVVAAGGSSTLSWTAAAGSALTLNGSAVASPSGSLTVSPSASTVYTLTATLGSVTDTRSLTIVALPPAGVAVPSPTVTTGPVSKVKGVTFTWTPVTARGGMGAGSSITGYGLTIVDALSGTKVFDGSLTGGGSDHTLVDLAGGDYIFGVRACTGGEFTDAACGAYATSSVKVDLVKPTETPVIAALPSSNLTTSTQTFGWSPVAKADASLDLFYELVLENVATKSTVLQITVPESITSTIASLGSSNLYSLKVRACQSECGDYSDPLFFSLQLPPVPSAAPPVAGPSVVGNRLDASWSAVSGADLYQIQVVQPNAGPGGGALTVAAQQVSTTNVSLEVPPGQASIVVAACNGDGCGPFSTPISIDPTGPSPSTPNPGTPMAGTIVAGPTVLFTWNRIPGDDGTNTTYRVYVQDLSRQSAALDVLTSDNFYAAYFKAEGARYDVLVIANPICDPLTGVCTGGTLGPAVGFNVSGTSANAPTMVFPTHNSTLAQGNIQLGWSPVAGATLYEYYVAVQGISAPTVRGVTPGLFVQVPLAAVGGVSTIYSGIVRACPAGATCAAGSDAGWGPWSVDAGPGVTNFTVTP